ncbi:MAG TPA: threonine synthase [Candidatus Sulfotelmatobacter sp.]|jgi:threonine synthase|nr:threonine synthase [Candidatus Sulfotelmatobacter sp.]
MLTHLECTRCGEHYPADRPQTVCPKDGGILYARYDLAAIKRSFSSARLALRAPTMWRYDAVLPDANPVSLGEGFTPMLPSREYPNVYIKDEGLNPTGSFKARGLSAAVTMARHLGLKKLAVPSAGNAAGALAAYSAAAGLEAHIFMPKDVPAANRIECDYYGAHVTLVEGLISDCAKKVAQLKDSDSWTQDGWFDVSTTKEPYRVEGKKTMGYEVAEQLGWRMPQGIIYPTGGGVGLLGMWKAFEEMEALGWIGPERPKMIVVQSAGCAPVIKAWDEGKKSVEMWTNAATLASGLRVPKPYGDYLILDILKKSKGTAVSATDEEILEATRHWSKVEGIFAAPEGAACLVAYRKLRANGFFKPEDAVILFNTGSGLKYLDVLDARVAAGASPAKPAAQAKSGTRQIAGIIGPY